MSRDVPCISHLGNFGQRTWQRLTLDAFPKKRHGWGGVDSFSSFFLWASGPVFLFVSFWLEKTCKEYTTSYFLLKESWICTTLSVLFAEEATQRRVSASCGTRRNASWRSSGDPFRATGAIGETIDSTAWLGERISFSFLWGWFDSLGRVVCSGFLLVLLVFCWFLMWYFFGDLLVCFQWICCGFVLLFGVCVGVCFVAVWGFFVGFMSWLFLCVLFKREFVGF